MRRARKRRKFRCALQALEPRVLPSGSPAAFATVDGLSGTSRHPAVVGLAVSPAAFSTPGRRLVLDVTLSGDPGYPTPHLLDVRPGRGARLQVLSGPAQGQGTRVVEVGLGTYRVFVAAAGKGPAPFHVHVALAGDVNGDFRVDRTDIAQIRDTLGRKAGQPGYLVSADVNRNGVIDPTDLRLARLDLGSRRRSGLWT
jgi:hypothetical protein